MALEPSYSKAPDGATHTLAGSILPQRPRLRTATSGVQGSPGKDNRANLVAGHKEEAQGSPVPRLKLNSIYFFLDSGFFFFFLTLCVCVCVCMLGFGCSVWAPLVVVGGLSCPVTCGVLVPQQRIKTCIPCIERQSQPLDLQGSTPTYFYSFNSQLNVYDLETYIAIESFLLRSRTIYSSQYFTCSTVVQT